ncbi:cobalamin-dependent protein [Streptomyces sp. NPDC004539]|uniref:cobalamin-dependent protein n=1 Tax=Streptomyces sp. NPDC004539 TaxID=3154280 RepID=UPI0033A3A8D1
MGVAAGPIRVVVAEVGEDGAGREGEAVARALRDAGVEVVHAGFRQTPGHVVRTALQEDADAVGLFGARGAFLTAVVDLLREEDASDVVVFGGGGVTEAEIPGLREKGVAEIFVTGAGPRAVVEWVRGNVRGAAYGS